MGGSILNTFTISCNLTFAKKSWELGITVSTLKMRKLRLKEIDSLNKDLTSQWGVRISSQVFDSKTCASSSSVFQSHKLSHEKSGNA